MDFEISPDQVKSLQKTGEKTEAGAAYKEYLRRYARQEHAEHAVGSSERKCHFQRLAGRERDTPTLERAGQRLRIVH